MNTPDAQLLVVTEAIEDVVPEDLQSTVKDSLWVPQMEPYHCEGPFMYKHLFLVLVAIDRLLEGTVDKRVPKLIADLMIASVVAVGLKVCHLYVLLHDIDKTTCLQFKRDNGRDPYQMSLWEWWKSCTRAYPDFDPQSAEYLEYVFHQEEITQISYYQKVDGKTRNHGPIAAKRLQGREDIPALVIEAIGEHEAAFTFGNRGGVNIPLIEKLFTNRTEEQAGFILAVNYADQKGTLTPEGDANLKDFLWMAQSYIAWKQLEALKDRLAGTERLDIHRVERLTAELRKDVNAFVHESVDAAYSRIVEACSLPEVTEEQVRAVLAGVKDLSEEDMRAIVHDMTTGGKLSRLLGKKLGKLNGAVRAALATLD